MASTDPGTMSYPTRRPGGRGDPLGVLLWALSLLAAALALVLPVLLRNPTIWVLLLSVPFAVIHGLRRYGAASVLFLLVETLLVSNFFENLSVWTGFPFGHYHYTIGPKILEVPAIIGLVYFGLGYLCWQLGRVLVQPPGGASAAYDVVLVPVVAALLMSMFDLGSDSLASTVNGVWVWEHGGGVFGVPYVNYLGWILVTYLFFQVFALRVHRTGALTCGAAREAWPCLVFYASLGVSSIVYAIRWTSGTVTDRAGVRWSVGDITSTMMLINIFTVLFAALLVVVRLVQAQPAGRGPGAGQSADSRVR